MDWRIQKYLNFKLRYKLRGRRNEFKSSEMATAEETRSRSNTAVWLVGHPSATFPSSKLPSKGDVLRFLFFKHNECNKTLAQSIKETADSVGEIWDLKLIPTKHICLPSFNMCVNFTTDGSV